MKNAFKVGDVVVNFGNVAVVQEVDAGRGLLLKALPGQSFGRDDRWHADPSKTVPVVEVVREAVVMTRNAERSASRMKDALGGLQEGRL